MIEFATRLLRWRGLTLVLAVLLLAGGFVALGIGLSSRHAHHRSVVTQAAAPQMSTLVSRTVSSVASGTNSNGSAGVGNPSGGIPVRKWTTLSVVRLADGSTTTVHQRGRWDTYTVGMAMNVVVDPDDHGYAEVPGSPFSSGTTWPVFVGAAALWVVGLLLIAARVRARRSPASMPV